MNAASPENDAPAWCPFKGWCAYPGCVADLDQCASAVMASGPRRTFPDVEPRRPRRPFSPATGQGADHA